MNGDGTMTWTIPEPPTWWDIQKKRMLAWWLRRRVRLSCWLLRIDGFNIRMKGTIRSWETNIPQFNLRLEGNMDLMDGGTFTHKGGTMTFIDALDVVGGTFTPATQEYVESDGTVRIFDDNTGKLKPQH